jgi:hypothetical protein
MILAQGINGVGKFAEVHRSRGCLKVAPPAPRNVTRTSRCPFPRNNTQKRLQKPLAPFSFLMWGGLPPAPLNPFSCDFQALNAIASCALAPGLANVRGVFHIGEGEVRQAMISRSPQFGG